MLVVGLSLWGCLFALIAIATLVERHFDKGKQAELARKKQIKQGKKQLGQRLRPVHYVNRNQLEKEVLNWDFEYILARREALDRQLEDIDARATKRYPSYTDWPKLLRRKPMEE